ncbi:hypothetical protein [Pontibacillus sp. HMF3514]|uniref:hypothetical protein n=1 Tax=Pontibacillus sp. HMF3514 TaxID=2692425 RepID=UPI0013202946|nr:hypothetical protein [Pontibacillus sp. HMF3514]QHE51769.1 hypothetical protein GS400_06835 [Pontibacillus sp. HMF3514]
MNNKRNALILLSFITIVLTISLLNYEKKIYGNNKESIIKLINSIEGYEHYSINILEIRDFEDVRVVAFLANNSPAYMRLEKNEEENYYWNSIRVARNEDFENFIPDLPREEQPRFMIVKNQQSDIAKMEVDVNKEKVHKTFKVDQPSVSWLVFPKTDKSHFTFRNYKYYDKNGEPIER